MLLLLRLLTHHARGREPLLELGLLELGLHPRLDPVRGELRELRLLGPLPELIALVENFVEP